MNYKPVNKALKKNKYPVPLINLLINKLDKTKFFSRLDSKEVYHGLHIKEGNK